MQLVKLSFCAAGFDTGAGVVSAGVGAGAGAGAGADVGAKVRCGFCCWHDAGISSYSTD